MSKSLLYLYLPLGWFFFWGSLSVAAQESARNEGAAWVPSFSYGGQIPAGDLSARFGAGFSPAADLHWMSKRTNWLLGIQGQFLFGSRVKEDVLAGLRTEAGYIIGNDRSPADIQLRMRGGYAGAQVGKLWPSTPRNPRSGIRAMLGGGWLQHRIRIQKDPVRYVAQVEGDYEKGYDRLSGGPALYQSIGYQVFSRDGQRNLFVVLEAVEGFSTGLRAVQFDLEAAETGRRLDVLLGVRMGMAIPWYQRKGHRIWY